MYFKRMISSFFYYSCWLFLSTNLSRISLKGQGHGLEQALNFMMIETGDDPPAIHHIETIPSILYELKISKPLNTKCFLNSQKLDKPEMFAPFNSGYSSISAHWLTDCPGFQPVGQ
jgi:hypothetical protein